MSSIPRHIVLQFVTIIGWLLLLMNGDKLTHIDFDALTYHTEVSIEELYEDEFEIYQDYLQIDNVEDANLMRRIQNTDRAEFDFNKNCFWDIDFILISIAHFNKFLCNTIPFESIIGNWIYLKYLF